MTLPTDNYGDTVIQAATGLGGLGSVGQLVLSGSNNKPIDHKN